VGDGDDVNAAVSFVMPIDDMVREALNADLAGVPMKFPVPSWIIACPGDGGLDLFEEALTQLPSAAFGEVRRVWRGKERSSSAHTSLRHPR
jgi:hypothetical protein